MFDDANPYHRLCMHLFLARPHSIQFEHFLANLVQNLGDLFPECTRVVKDRYSIEQCLITCTQRTGQSMAALCRNAVNYYLERAVSNMTLPPTFFTSLTAAQIGTYIDCLVNRGAVQQLIQRRNAAETVEQTRVLTAEILRLGGENMSEVVNTEEARLFHKFFVNMLFSARSSAPLDVVGPPPAPALIITLTPKAQLHVIRPQHVPAQGFACVRCYDSGKACGKEARLRCNKCRRAFYCSSKCQRADTAMHASECDLQHCIVCKRGRHRCKS